MLVILTGLGNLLGIFFYLNKNLLIPNRFPKPVRNVTYYSAVITIVAGFNPFALAVNSNLPDLLED
jgi:uncharacterized membrane protein YidH (DUF202 family)